MATSCKGLPCLTLEGMPLANIDLMTNCELIDLETMTKLPI